MARTSPSGKMSARVGNYRADIDTTGMDPEDKAFFTERNKEPAMPAAPSGSGIVNATRGALKKMGQGFGRLMGNRPTTSEEEAHYKSVGQQNYYNAKSKKDFQK